MTKTLPAEGDWVQVWIYNKFAEGLVTVVENGTFMVEDTDGRLWICTRQTIWSKIT
jgi:hypothetical protein